MTSATLAGDVHIADVKAISLTGSTRNGVITLENVSAAQARLDNQDGGIAVTASEIGQLDMETSAGDIEGDDLRLENASAVTKNGMIGFNRLNAQTLHAENNDGGIAVTGGEIGALWARTLSGDVRLEQLTCAGSEVSVSSGEIVLRGAFSGENRLDNLDGSIEFDTSLPQENYAYEAETKDGTVYLNGSECGARAANTAAAANRVIANTNAGDITLSFEG